ncbi:MAG: dTMP kinase [Candidatus Omnitrophota bacterium]
MGVRKGIFITFEGFEGSGKSTQAKLLCRYLRRKKMDVLHVREPGGVNISEKVRQILLDVKNKKMTKVCETLLYMAARAQLVEEVILPALRKGKVVVCDRFLDSTLAYQGYGCGVNIELIKMIGRFATQDVSPHLTLLFDIDVKKGLARAGRVKDRIESRSLDYHNRVRQGYLKIAKQNPKRIRVIDSLASKEEIQKSVCAIINRFLKI